MEGYKGRGVDGWSIRDGRVEGFRDRGMERVEGTRGREGEV